MRPQRGKQKIFDAAMKLFESQGYFKTTVEEITTEAGVSKGLVYNYFSSKAELLAGLIEDATDKIEAVAEPLSMAGTLEESLSRFIDSFFDYLQKERAFLRLQLTLLLMPELREIVAEPQQKRAELLLNTVSAWFKKAGVSQSKKKARLLLAMLDGIALHYLCIYESYPLSSMKPQLIKTAMDLCARPEKGITP